MKRRDHPCVSKAGRGVSRARLGEERGEKKNDRRHCVKGDQKRTNYKQDGHSKLIVPGKFRESQSNRFDLKSG